MPRLPRVSAAEVCRALREAGFLRHSQRGSHIKLKHADGRIAIVPDYSELATGTLRSILRQAGLSVEEFLDLLA
jgi:predicted RNA binding protein YcfA (HicA-like mRNA interferase family)